MRETVFRRGIWDSLPRFVFGWGFGLTVFLHCVSGVVFMVFRCGPTELKIIQIILTLSFEDELPV